jgi:hypothetical protein
VRGTPAAAAVKRKGARTWRQRLDIAGRAFAAIVVGYLFASLATAVLARLLPGPTAEATIAATTLSFAVYAAVAVWCFGDPKAARLWLGLAAGCAILSAILWISLMAETRL